jgi:uncharacterized protein (UPF0332 family)
MTEREASHSENLIQVRLMQSMESLRDARLLAEHGEGFRSIVNRCYYSCFYAVLALLQSVNLTPRSHKSALVLFGREFIKQGKLPSELFSELLPAYHKIFEMRQEDDYRRLSPVEKPEAEAALDIAQTFTNAVQKYFKASSVDESKGN